jgi:hypothetical protein
MYIKLNPEIWSFAALIGEARRRSNENKRNKSRDRGNANNIHVDLMGTVGELIAYKQFKNDMSHTAHQNFLTDLLRIEGGAVMKGADMTLDNLLGDAETLLVDVKTFDCEPNKRFFAINVKKHNSLNSQCHGYVCILIPKYAKYAFMVNYVPYQDVSTWQEKALGNYGDPSKNCHINQFQTKYTGRDNIIELLKAKGTFEKELISSLLKDIETQNKFKKFAPQIGKIFWDDAET